MYFGGLYAYGSFLHSLKDGYFFTKASQADASIQSFVDSLCRQRGIASVPVYVRDLGGSDMGVCRGTIVIAPEDAHRLSQILIHDSLDADQERFAYAGAIHHEIGHIYYRDSLRKHVLKTAIATGALYCRVPSCWSLAVCGRGFAVLGGLYMGLIAYARHRELSADDSVPANPAILTALASEYERDARIVQKQYGNDRFGMYEFWHDPVHPASSTRAKRFRDRLAHLEVS